MSTIDTTLDVQIKTAHRRMWASGDYPAVAREVVRGHEKVPTGGQVEVPAGGQIEVPTLRVVS